MGKKQEGERVEGLCELSEKKGVFTQRTRSLRKGRWGDACTGVRELCELGEKNRDWFSRKGRRACAKGAKIMLVLVLGNFANSARKVKIGFHTKSAELGQRALRLCLCWC